MVMNYTICYTIIKSDFISYVDIDVMQAIKIHLMNDESLLTFGRQYFDVGYLGNPEVC